MSDKKNSAMLGPTPTKIHANIVMMGLVSFFIDFGKAMVAPLVPIFLIEYLKSDYTSLGIVVAISTFVTYGMRFLSGFLVEKFQKAKPFLTLGYLLSSLAQPLLAMVHSWVGVAILQSMERFGKGIREAPRDALIASFIRQGDSGKSFGFHRVFDMSGHFLGTLAVFVVLYFCKVDEQTFRSIFLLSALPGFIGVLIVIFLVEDVKPKIQTIEKISLTKEERSLLFFLLIYAGFSSFLFTEPFFVMRAKDTGFETYHIPLLVMVLTLTQALTSYPVGRAIDRFGSKKVLFLSYVAGVVTTLLLFFKEPFAIALSFALFGIFTTFSLNAIRAEISNTAINKAFVFGIFYTILAFAFLISSVVVGRIWDLFGSYGALGVSLGGLVLFFVVYLILWQKCYNQRIIEGKR